MTTTLLAIFDVRIITLKKKKKNEKPVERPSVFVVVVGVRSHCVYKSSFRFYISRKIP